ncbi:ABC transporter substrate-binding protein [uncultured Robinsoniella sp.]|uniref:ABC transporter substrate-binding protein n=1 Tax=uncultured Robinsoniella sp. TaxID=904190 RepID=UPI00374FD375
MKKVLVLGMVFAMCIPLLSGCGKKNETVTLTVWGDADNQSVVEGAFTEINEAFEKANPDIKLDYQYSGTFDTINVAVQSDSLPDLFWVQGNKSTKMAELAQNGYLLNLDEYKMDASRYPQSSIDYATVDGSVYCSYPAFIDYVTVYYNKDLFEKAGVKKPENFGEFESALETLKESGVTPIALGGKGDFDRYWLIQLMAPALCNDTLAAIKNGEEPDYAPMTELFDKYREYSEKGYMGKDFTSIDGVGAQLAFTNGQAAMSIDGTWNNQMYKDLSFEVGSFAFPSADGTRYAQSGESQYNTYAVAKKTEHPEQAVKYLQFLNSKEAEQILEDHVGSIPAVKDLTPKDETVSEHSDFDQVGFNIYHVLSGVADENGKPQDILLGDVLPKLMMSEMSGEDAVTKIQEEIAKSSVK